MVYPKVRLTSTLPSAHGQRDPHTVRTQRDRVIASLVLDRGRHSASSQPYVNPNRGIY